MCLGPAGFPMGNSSEKQAFCIDEKTFALLQDPGLSTVHWTQAKFGTLSGVSVVIRQLEKHLQNLKYFSVTDVSAGAKIRRSSFVHMPIKIIPFKDLLKLCLKNRTNKKKTNWQYRLTCLRACVCVRENVYLGWSSIVVYFLHLSS